MKKNTSILLVIFVMTLVSVAPQTTHAQCWLNAGPQWMNCDYGDSGNGGSNNNNSNNGDLNVSTLSAINVDTDSATLRGEITDLDSDNDYVRFFEWGTSSSNLSHTTTLSGTTNDTGTFSRTLTGLNDNEEYFYRACAENDNNSNDDDCGSTRSFFTDNGNGNNNNNDGSNSDAAVFTTNATGVTSASAILNGVVMNDGGSQTVWFEWGTTMSLGNRTNSQYVSNDQSAVSASITGLTPVHTYYFRIVSNNGDRGDIFSFITAGTVDSNSYTPTHTGGSTGTTTSHPSTSSSTVVNSGQYLNVDLVGSVKEVRPSDEISFAAVYENLTNKALHNIVLSVDVPEGLEIVSSEVGTVMGTSRVEVVIPEIAPHAKGNFMIAAKANSKGSNQRFLVSIIEAVYDHPVDSNTRIDTTDYSIMKMIGGRTNLSANALSSGTFFPHSFLGWMVLAFGIGILIFLGRKLYKEKEEEKKHGEDAHHSGHPELKIAK